MLKKMNVSTKIFGGFTLVLVLSIVTFLTALTSIWEINKGLNTIAEQSVPIIEEGSVLSKAMLESNITLLQLYNERQLEKVESQVIVYQSYEAMNYESEEKLSTLTEPLPNIKQLLSQSVEGVNQYHVTAKNVIELHKQTLVKRSETAEAASNVADLADEMISYIYDLESTVSDSSQQQIITQTGETLENLAGVLASSAVAQSKFEVLSSRSLVQDLFAQIENNLNQLSQAPNLVSDETMLALSEQQAQFSSALTGDNVLEKKLSTLESAAKTRTQLNKAQEQSHAALSLLNQFNQAVEEYTIALKKEASETVASTQALIIGLGIVVILLSVFVSLFVTHSIRKPLNSAVANIKKVATGDLTVDFGPSSHDELGALTDNMKILVNSFREILKEISESSNVLATTAEESTSISQQSYQSVIKQKDQSRIVNDSIGEMAGSITEVARSINGTLEVVEVANKEAIDGEKLLRKNINSIQSLSSAIDSAASVIGKLNEETTNISSVLDVIRGVAEQTNLLALNAAIEAARAGEQGRGFAVVADEVRTLASRAHDSTAEIQQLIERLLEGAGKAVKTMEQSKSETQHCVEGINEAGETLSAISRGIQSIKDMSQTIASASEEQSANAQMQTENVQLIADLAEQTSSSAEKSKVSSQELARMAEKQRELSRKFKI